MTIESTQTLKPSGDRLMLGVALRAATVLIGTLLTLSIFSYDHFSDSPTLYGGTNRIAVNNWVGRLGAWSAHVLFELLGLAVYPALLIFLLCILVRVVAPKKVKPVSGSYFMGILFAILGFAMAFGVFPDVLQGLCKTLNVHTIPGGVIGNRLSAPDHGLLYAIVNPVGSVIISITMILLGFLAIWYFDWQELTTLGWAFAKKKWQGDDSDENAVDEFAHVNSEQAHPEVDVPIPETIKEVFEDPPVPPVAMKPKPKPAVAVSRDDEMADKPAILDKDKYANFRLPSIKLLNEVKAKGNQHDPREVAAKKQALQQTLESFGIDAALGSATCGPRVTLFEIKPAPGVKVEKISGLQNNIKMNLRAESLRILTPIPGKDSVGIEVPNSTSSIVHFRDLLQSNQWKDFKGALPVCLGKDISGKPVILDLGKAPHLLIAGATGSGKSVCMNALILSLIYRFKPDELKMIMIDPKVVEFAGYSKLPHLVAPVINEVKKVPIVLNWAVKEMERRYQILSKVGVRNLAAFNARKPEIEPVMDDDGNPIPAKLPYIVLIIDELADIMMTAKQEVETLLARIAQMARAIGIHAVIATQRPSVNVITGIIKANFPTRIAFRVTSLIDSRTIIDGKGAEALLGYGDMLFKSPTGSNLERVQGCFLEDSEIESVVGFIASQGDPHFAEDIFTVPDLNGENTGNSADDEAVDSAPPVFNENGFADNEEGLIQHAIQVILRDKRATTSHIQRRLRIGYNRASIIIEELQRRGIVGPQIGSAPRDILISEEDVKEMNETDGEDE